MVKILKQAELTAIDKAAREVEEETSVIVRLVVVSSSYPYNEFILFYGFLLGSLASAVLWQLGTVQDWPWLMLVQIGLASVVDLVPWLRHICIRLVPGKILRRHAEQQAYWHYHALHDPVPAGEPFVLLFVSLAEHYVHVITNPAVHEEIPGDWHQVTDKFTAILRQENLKAACLQAVEIIRSRVQVFRI